MLEFLKNLFYRKPVVIDAVIEPTPDFSRPMIISMPEPLASLDDIKKANKE
jgi:hypothetical protein